MEKSKKESTDTQPQQSSVERPDVSGYSKGSIVMYGVLVMIFAGFGVIAFVDGAPEVGVSYFLVAAYLLIIIALSKRINTLTEYIREHMTPPKENS